MYTQLIILETVFSLKENIRSIENVSDILSGNGYFRNHLYFGKLSFLTKGQIAKQIVELISISFLELQHFGYLILDLTDEGKKCVTSNYVFVENIVHKFTPTVTKTYDLYRENINPQQIANFRNLKLTTILGHFAVLIEKEIISITNIMGEFRIQQILDVLPITGLNLFFIRNELPNNFLFGEIKCVLATNPSIPKKEIENINEFKRDVLTFISNNSDIGRYTLARFLGKTNVSSNFLSCVNNLELNGKYSMYTLETILEGIDKLLSQKLLAKTNEKYPRLVCV